MVENLEELGLTSLRMVSDEIMYHGGNIKDFSIPSSLLLACQSAHMKYKNDLDRKKAESEKTGSNKQKKTVNSRINIVKKKADEQSLIKQLKSDSDKFVLQAGCCRDEISGGQDCRGERKEAS